ncbi:YIP1 family protein [Paenibacillus thalictri]|uniref:Nuclease PIN n=1 Tax=Paenibacillus thalictri TaxID=2527873 RepID=A0A4Q9DDV7_9BACL|nr:SMP-30/gluconolactonase/LRE family protein [Paenibacillus thalictri]TBL68576.1 nuclease PIN [Paenibacillus thalictri]
MFAGTIKGAVRRWLIVLLAAVAGSAVVPFGAEAAVPYSTNYKDAYERLTWTQSAYYPVEALGKDIYIADPKDPSKSVYSPLVKPKDIFVDDRDQMYVADTGNNRIVLFNEKGRFVKIIDVKESPLNKPEGVFVSPNGDIYAADTGNKRVVKLDANGKLLKEYKRPDSTYLPESFKYDPIKLVTDKRGFLYIATLGGYQGLLQLDPDGKFIGFFGANKTAFSVMDSFKRLIYTREMYMREMSKLPGSAVSVDIDDSGFIYTVTKDVERGQIKKLNIAGKDMLSAKSDFSTVDGQKSYGEFRFPSRDKLKPQLSDITVDQDGNVTAIDASMKYMNQYDASGNLLFFWSGESSAASSRLGVIKTPSAITSNSHSELLVLDEDQGLIQLLRLSEFGAIVHKANKLTQEGKYEESEAYWREAYRLNAYYAPALLGLAKAAYKKGDYAEAQKLFLDAGNQAGYSDAYWQLRLIWFQKHFGTLMNLLIGVALLVIVWKKLLARRLRPGRGKERNIPPKYRMLEQIKHVLVLIKHPLDGFIAIRYEGKGGFWSSLLLLVLATVSFGVMQAFTSFVFNPGAVLEVNIVSEIVKFLLLWCGWVVSNYLISAIYRGEGRLRDVAYSGAYAMFPFIVIGLPLTLISNVMTLSEDAIFGFLKTGMYVWIALLVFWKVQAMQNYSIRETAANIAMSLLTMMMLGALIFITFGLSSEMKDFFYSVYQEVIVR